MSPQDREKNYSTMEKEALAIVFATQHFHFSFHFIFNSLDMVAPQIQRSGLQGTMLKTSI